MRREGSRWVLLVLSLGSMAAGADPAGDCAAKKGRWTRKDGAEGCVVKGLAEGTWKRHRAGGQPAEVSTWHLGQREGPAVKYHDNCQVAERGEFRKGRREGPWVFFSTSGRKLREGPYREGRLEGTWTFFDPDSGQKQLEGPFVAGVGHGRFTEYFASGARWREVELAHGERVGPQPEACRARGGRWDVDYRARSEGCSVEERPEGTWTGYDGAGRVRWTAEYKHGRFDGLYEDFHPGGALLRRGRYVGGVPEGLHEFRGPKGELYGSFSITQGSGPYRTYHPNGRPAEEGLYVAGCPDGAWKSWNEEGALLVEETYARCVREGPYVAYHPSGQRRLSGRYASGQQSGRWESFYVNGDPEWVGDYEEGARSGTWSLYRWGRRLDAQGPMVDGFAEGAWTMYHPSGERRAVGTYEGGRRLGTWQEYFSTGEPWRKVTYVDGVEAGAAAEACRRWQGTWEADGEQRTLGCLVCRVGPEDAVTQVGVGRWVSWHPSGAVEKEGELVEGKPHGPWRFFYDNGLPMLEGSFREGVEEGRWLGAYRNGQPRFRGAYRAGHPEGEWTSFHPDGGVLSVGRYHLGQKQGRWRYVDQHRTEEVDYLPDGGPRD